MGGRQRTDQGVLVRTRRHSDARIRPPGKRARRVRDGGRPDRRFPGRPWRPETGPYGQVRRDGTHVETTPRRTVADPTFTLRLGDYRRLRNGAAVGSTLSHIAHRPANSRPNVHVVVFQPGDATLDTVLTYHAGASGYRIDGRSGVFFPPFGPSGAWDVAGDSMLYLANGVSGKVVVLGVDDTTIDTVATIDMGKQGQMITQADLRRTRTRLVEEMELPEAAVDLRQPCFRREDACNTAKQLPPQGCVGRSVVWRRHGPTWRRAHRRHGVATPADWTSATAAPTLSGHNSSVHETP